MIVGRTRTTPIMEDSDTSKLSIPTANVDCEPMSLFGMIPTIKEDNKSNKRSNKCTSFLENAFNKHWPSVLSIKPQDAVDSMAIINEADRELAQRRRESVGEGDIVQSTRVPPSINLASGTLTAARQCATSSSKNIEESRWVGFPDGDVQTSNTVGSERAHYAKRLKTPQQENLLGKPRDSSTTTLDSHCALRNENSGDSRRTVISTKSRHTGHNSTSSLTSSTRKDQGVEPLSPSATAAAITTANPVLKDSGCPNMLKGRPHPHRQGEASSSSSTPRPRSRAIAIKRRSNNYFNMYGSSQYGGEFPTNQSENTSEQMYDWATWRMYNRIVDHRRNQQRIKARKGTSSASGPATPAGGLFPISVGPSSVYDSALDARNDDPYEADVLGSCDYIHDGEVFELDDI